MNTIPSPAIQAEIISTPAVHQNTITTACTNMFSLNLNVVMVVRFPDHSGTSQITRTEMAAALAHATRMGLIPGIEGGSAWNEFLGDWESITRLKVSGQVIERSSVLAWTYPLRGYDALHLASAILWQETLETQVILATFDRGLWSAGSQAGLTVWPENCATKSLTHRSRK